MSFLKKHWYIPTGLLLFCVVIGVFMLNAPRQPVEPQLTYVMPERTGDVTVAVKRSAQVARLPQSDTTIVAEPHDHEPTVKLVDEAVNQMMEESLEDNPVVESQQDDIGEIEEVPEASTPEPEFSRTLGDIMKSNGMTDSELQVITGVLPLDPNINIASEEFIEHVNSLGKIVDREMYEIMGSLDVDLGRELVQSFKDDPEVTAEGFQLLVDEYLPVHIKDALRQEGVLQ